VRFLGGSVTSKAVSAACRYKWSGRVGVKLQWRQRKSSWPRNEVFGEVSKLNTLQQTAKNPEKSSFATNALARLKKLPRLFYLVVVAPTVIAALYYGLIASDIYVSEAKFIVRSPQQQQQASLFSALLQSTGFSRAQDDTYAVHDYILSRDALTALEASHLVRGSFDSQKADFFDRFPGPDRDESFEALYKYFRRHVDVDYDTTSSITTLTVRAYSAEDSQRIAERLLALSENLINQLNVRARQDMIGSAQREELKAESRAKDAALALLSFRDRATVFDPDKQSLLQLQQVSGLQQSLTETETQLSQIRALTPKNPQIPALEERVRSLQSAIEQSRAQVSTGQSSLSNKSSEYALLQLEQSFAEHQLASAMSNLENAKNEADRKQLYLDRLVQPNRPDIAIEPKRLRSIAVVFGLGMIVWGILSLLLAGVREHHD
jgi:capsular polysaccharide transport system permease protein